MMNWEIHPPSIYHTLIKLSQYQLNTPLYITENGIVQLPTKLPAKWKKLEITGVLGKNYVAN
jgi:hypothetical protein